MERERALAAATGTDRAAMNPAESSGSKSEGSRGIGRQASGEFKNTSGCGECGMQRGRVEGVLVSADSGIPGIIQGVPV